MTWPAAVETVLFTAGRTHDADRSATAVRSIGGLLIQIWVAYDSVRERKAGSH